MTAQGAHKYRIYPTKNQQDFLAKQFGAVRFIYNYFLASRIVEYQTNKTTLNYFDNAKSLTSLKQEDGYVWLKDIITQSLQASLKNLDTAYKSFFKKQNKFPRFHSKKNRQSFKIPQRFSVEGDKLYISKLKSGIEIVLHRPLPYKINSCSISKTPSGKYYASFQGELDVKQLPQSEKSIGIDLGIKSLLVMSDGQTENNPKFYRKAEKKLAYKQRQLSKKQKGSRGQEKARLEVAKLNEWISNCRKDNLHKISKKLIDENQVIILESLNVKGMIQNHCLAKSIQDASWGGLIRQLKYKSEWYGRTFYQISQWFPSSKTCHHCKHIVNKLPLNIREWQCPNCGEHLDRDLNAALNIRDKGLADLKAMSGSGIESDNKSKLGEALSAKAQPKKKRQAISKAKGKSMKPDTLAFKR